MEYANAKALRGKGIDPTPRHGDVVEWISNGERWTVCAEDDLDGPCALNQWPGGDATWLLVRFLRRDIIEGEEK